MHLPPNNGGDFTPPPQGTHLAICYRVIDLGTQLIEWQGERKTQRKIMLSWEFPNELMEDGKPFSVNQRYTLSSHEKAKLRQDLEAWRGVPFQDSDFGPNGAFDIRNVIGKGCFITILHTEKQGKTYANIRSIAKPPKGTEIPELTNKAVYFSLDDFNQAVFDGLSQGLRDVIAKSPEFAKLGTKKEPMADAETSREHDDLSDEIPF